MSIPFKNPQPDYRYDIAHEKAVIEDHFTKRNVPFSTPGKLLLASWNIANLGAQKRWPEALELISVIMRHFDLLALQELNDDFQAFIQILDYIGQDFNYIMSDPTGNQERLCFVYRKNTVQPGNLFAELALRTYEYPQKKVYVKWMDKQKQNCVEVYPDLEYIPFDRNPYIGSFRVTDFTFTLVNVHLYFGDFQNSRKTEQRAKYARRVLEIYALSKWADRRHNKKTTYSNNVILLGDMNVPVMEATEDTYKALTKFGWKPLDYNSRTGGSNLGNDKTYDQMVFSPGTIRSRITDSGVFDFDNVVFKKAWDKYVEMYGEKRAVGKFNSLVKHHISDHRPVWIQLDTN